MILTEKTACYNENISIQRLCMVRWLPFPRTYSTGGLMNQADLTGIQKVLLLVEGKLRRGGQAMLIF